jgi:FMN phosphatase YigB (HAD superfamily)
LDNKIIIAFDLDDTLCRTPKNFETVERYKHCKPIKKNINILNKLFFDGYFIKIYTARGINSYKGDVKKIEKNLKKLTVSQLKNWKVNYHELIFGKQEYQLLIDDKAINVKDMKSFKNLKSKFLNL